jgi:hypothetical protein
MLISTRVTWRHVAEDWHSSVTAVKTSNRSYSLIADFTISVTDLRIHAAASHAR